MYVFSVNPGWADVVYLKDGTLVEGTFISDTTTGMYFEIEKDGRKETVKFEYDQIESVDFTTTHAANEKERERIQLNKQEKKDKKRGMDLDKAELEDESTEVIQLEDINVEEVVKRAQQIAEELGLIQTEKKAE
jgi:hypothetical protein